MARPAVAAFVHWLRTTQAAQTVDENRTWIIGFRLPCCRFRH